MDFDFILKNNKNDFQSGINIIEKLTDSKVILTVANNSDSFFKNIKNVEIIQVSGPHPSAKSTANGISG